MDHGEAGCGSGHDHDAINRLFELAREGETGSGEFQQLDNMVFEGLVRRYGVQPDATGDRITQPA